MVNKVVTFDQDIGDEHVRVSIPERRVDSIVTRVEKYVESGDIEKAKKTLKPFLAADVVDIPAPKRATTRTRSKSSEDNDSDVNERRQIVDRIIKEHRDQGRKAVIDALRQELSMSYPNAYYYVQKEKIK